MGVRLLKYFDYAKEKGGISAQMHLALKFGMPSIQAADAPDSTENIKKIQEALQDILGAPNIPNL